MEGRQNTERETSEFNEDGNEEEIALLDKKR